MQQYPQLQQLQQLQQQAGQGVLPVQGQVPGVAGMLQPQPYAQQYGAQAQQAQATPQPPQQQQAAYAVQYASQAAGVMDPNRNPLLPCNTCFVSNPVCSPARWTRA